MRSSQAVADVAIDDQSLLVELDGPPRLPLGRVRQAQIAEIFPLIAAVADVAGDGQGLLVKLDGPPRLPPGPRTPGPDC